MSVTFYRAIALQTILLMLIFALPVFGQERDSCAVRISAIETALAAEGPRAALFDEHLALLRETVRRGEEGLCHDLADSLRARLSEADV